MLGSGCIMATLLSLHGSAGCRRKNAAYRGVDDAGGQGCGPRGDGAGGHGGGGTGLGLIYGKAKAGIADICQSGWHWCTVSELAVLPSSMPTGGANCVWVGRKSSPGRRKGGSSPISQIMQISAACQGRRYVSANLHQRD